MAREGRVKVVSALSPDEQRRLLRVAVQLREGIGPDLATIPAADAGDPAWDAWRDGLRGQQEVALLTEKDRLLVEYRESNGGLNGPPKT